MTDEHKPTETHQFAGGGGGALTIDVFRPEGEVNGAAVLVWHGGGWVNGSPADVHDRAAALAAHGYTVFTPQYRLLDVAPWPAPLEDARAALEWVRGQVPHFGIDQDRIAVQGHSAGAHLALMTGTLDSAERPAAVVAYYPPIGFTPAERPDVSQLTVDDLKPDDLGRLVSWMLFPEPVSQEILDAASPYLLATEDFPPTALMEGTADGAIPYRAPFHLMDRLTGLGVDSELHLYATRGHEFDRAPSMLEITSRDAASFLERVVFDRARYDEEAERYPFPPEK